MRSDRGSGGGYGREAEGGRSKTAGGAGKEEAGGGREGEDSSRAVLPFPDRQVL
jgi:hypothetical protein